MRISYVILDLFKEDLGLYEFWGHCDVDMILGKIKDFVTDEILQKYDRILSHGHFTIYRNLESVMSVNKQKLNGYLFYEDVLSKPDNFSFDEWAGDKGGSSFIWQVLCRDKMYDEIVFHDIWVLKKHFVSYHFAKSKLNGEPLKDVVFVFDKKEGLIRISRNKREKTMYVHLQKRPMKISADFDFQSSKFIIVPNKFIKYTSCKGNPLQLYLFS